jgi:hypothetical protein
LAQVQRRGKVGAVFGTAVLCVLGFAVPAHGDQFEWSAPIEQNEQEFGGFSLRGVDCPTPQLCVGVDSAGQAVSYDPSGAGDPVRGVITTPPALAAGRACQPAPAQVQDGSGSCAESLVAVSCASVSACVGVNGTRNLAVIFDPADPVGSAVSEGVDDAPQAVDCPSPTRCVVASAGGAVEVIDPAAGTGVATDLTDGGFLVDLSCPHPDQCTALGVTGGGDPDSKVTTFNPGDIVGSEQTTTVPSELLESIDCTSFAQCTAVTGGDPPIRFTTFDPSPAPSFTFHSLGATFVTDLACPTATVCTATFGFGAVSAWNPQSSSGVSSFLQVAQNSLPVYAVSCSSATQCAAVDYQGKSHTYDASDENGGATTTQVDPGVASLGVSCLTGNECAAVGWAGQGGSDSTGYASRFDPGDPAGGQDLDLTQFSSPFTDASCATTVCVAVDRLGGATRWVPGSGTSATGFVSPASPLQLAVDCVSSPSPTSPQCTATNQLGNAVTFDAFDLTGETPYLVGGQRIAGVSCPAANLCAAVSQNGGIAAWDPADPDGTIASHLLQPAGQVGSALAVSCSDTTACTAVTARANGTGRVIDISLPGVATVETVQVPRGLSAVDCPTADLCAVGDDEGGIAVWEHSGTPERVLLEGASNILSIECPTSELCVAVDGVGQAFVGELVAAPQNTTPPTITGTATAGQQLTAVSGTWSGDPTSLAHRWLRCDANGDNCTEVAGDQTTYDLTAADVGFTIRVEEAATGPGGTSAPVLSARTGVVAATGGGGGGGGADGTASVGGASGSNAGVTVPVTCAGAQGAVCRVAFVLRGRKVVKGGRLVAVKPPKKQKRTIRLGSGGTTVAAGQTQRLTIALNPSGRRLLARLKRLSLRLEAVCGVAAPPQRVTIKGPGRKLPPKKKKKGGGGAALPTCT